MRRRRAPVVAKARGVELLESGAVLITTYVLRDGRLERDGIGSIAAASPRAGGRAAQPS